MSNINQFLNDFKTVRDLAVKFEGSNLKVQFGELKKSELKKSGIESETDVESTVLNEVIRNNNILRYLYAVNINVSDDNKYAILKYNVMRMKLYPLSTLARGIVIDIESATVVSQSFSKFWNVGEKNITPESVDADLAEFGIGYAVNKLDGSNITFRKVGDKNIVQSTGGLSRKITKYNGVEQKNLILFSESLVTDDIQRALDENPNYCLIFEVIGYSKIVVDYDKSFEGLHLLGIREMLDNNESVLLNQEVIREFASKYNIHTEIAHKVTSYQEISSLLKTPEFKGQEGVVVYVGDKIYKIKKDEYVLASVLNAYSDLNSKNITHMAKTISNLVVNDSVDDFLGFMKGSLSETYIEMIEIAQDVLADFEITVIQKIKNLNHLTDKEFYQNLNSLNIPKDFKGSIGSIRKGIFVLENNKTLINYCANKISNTLTIKPA